MQRILAALEKAILSVLIVLMVAVVILATVDLVWSIASAIARPPFVILTLETLLDLFAMFLLVLVGLELLDTVKAYVKHHEIHAEVVLLAAMIAVARKVITLDWAKIEPSVPVALAVLILGLAGAYFLLKRAGVTTSSGEE